MMQSNIRPVANGFSRIGSPVKLWIDAAGTSSRHECGCIESPQSSRPQTATCVLAITGLRQGPRRLGHLAPHALALGQTELPEDAKGLLREQQGGLKLWSAAANTFAVGKRIADIAIRLAQLVVIVARLRLNRQQQQVQQQAAEAIHKPEAVARDYLQKLKMSAQNFSFIRMLHSLGNSAVSLEAKWADICKHAPSQAPLRETMGELYLLSTESSSRLQQKLSRSGRALGADSERQFFKSAHTQAVIEQEAALKSLIFAQIMSASSP